MFFSIVYFIFFEKFRQWRAYVQESKIPVGDKRIKDVSKCFSFSRHNPRLFLFLKYFLQLPSYTISRYMAPIVDIFGPDLSARTQTPL